MGKLQVMSGREACAILQRFGFIKIRQRGSHIIMQRTDAIGTVTVPIPDHDELKMGTLRSIIRQSGVLRSEFEA